MNFLTMDIVTEEGQMYLKHNGLKVPVTADMAVGLKDYPKNKFDGHKTSRCSFG